MEVSLVKSVVLLSGGMDSYAALLLELGDTPSESVIALSVHYGQAHLVEIEFAKAQASRFGVRHVVSTVEIPGESKGALLGQPRRELDEDVSAFFVPFRNLLLITLGASMCQQVGARRLVLGCNLEDSQGFPDCRPDFIRYAELSLRESGYQIEISTPLVCMRKGEVGKLLHSLGGSLDQTYSCYLGTVPQCGRCPACKGRMGE